MYSAVAAPIAMNAARGTVRAGVRTSPLGTSALSMPQNAKMRTPEVWSTAEAGGMLRPGEARGIDEERADDDEGDERHELRDGRDLREARAGAHAAHVDAREQREHGDHDCPVEPGVRHADERREGGGEERQHGGRAARPVMNRSAPPMKPGSGPSPALT